MVREEKGGGWVQAWPGEGICSVSRALVLARQGGPDEGASEGGIAFLWGLEMSPQPSLEDLEVKTRVLSCYILKLKQAVPASSEARIQTPAMWLQGPSSHPPLVNSSQPWIEDCRKVDPAVLIGWLRPLLGGRRVRYSGQAPEEVVSGGTHFDITSRQPSFTLDSVMLVCTECSPVSCVCLYFALESSGGLFCISVFSQSRAY